jgi:hypothetical protein
LQLTQEKLSQELHIISLHFAQFLLHLLQIVPLHILHSEKMLFLHTQFITPHSLQLFFTHLLHILDSQHVLKLSASTARRLLHFLHAPVLGVFLIASVLGVSMIGSI